MTSTISKLICITFVVAIFDFCNLKLIRRLIGDDDELFRQVSYNRRLDMINYIIKTKGDVLSDNDAVRWAALNGHLDIIKYIDNQKFYTRSHIGDILCYASINGHINIVKYYIESGENVHVFDDRPLRFASYGGHLELVKYLIGRGAIMGVNEQPY